MTWNRTLHYTPIGQSPANTDLPGAAQAVIEITKAHQNTPWICHGSLTLQKPWPMRLKDIDSGDDMGRNAQNVTPAVDEAVKKRIKDGKGKPQKEWRLEGEKGLVLITRSTGVGVFYFFYPSEFGKHQKLKLGEYGPMTLAAAKKAALDNRSAIIDGGDPVADKQARREAVTFRELATRFLAESPTLSASTRKVYGYTLAKDVYPIIGDKPAGAVTTDDVMAICKQIERSGASVQSERTKTTIGGVYRWALHEREAGVLANPCRDIGRRSPKVARTRTPTDSEIATLWHAMDNGTLPKVDGFYDQIKAVKALHRKESN